MSRSHMPVLMDSVLGLLAPQAGETVADLTVGLGGHAAAMAAPLGDSGTLVINDLDRGNLDRATEALAGVSARVIPVRGSFADLPRRLRDDGLRVDVVLADLGFASNQVDDPDRGLSFRLDGPLDMRLDPESPISAADIVHQTPERDLADLIYQYGEERASRRVASAIVRRRAERRFETTADLAEVVRRAVPGGHRQRIDPATRTFQAIRIAVNGELDALDALLAEIERGARAAVEAHSPSWLAPGARIGIISFHSLEDRPVKRAMLSWQQAELGERVTRKPAVADDDEAGRNPRSRSAKLRVFRVGEP